jgi:hypothetical protein
MAADGLLLIVGVALEGAARVAGAVTVVVAGLRADIDASTLACELMTSAFAEMLACSWDTLESAAAGWLAGTAATLLVSEVAAPS